MKHIPKYFSFKILFTLVFVLVFSNKMSANSTQLYTNSITESFSFNNLNDDDLETIDGIHIDVFEKEEVEEEFSNDFFATFQDKNVIIKKGFVFNQQLNTRPFSSEKKRYYILYCQLKTHL